MFAPSVFSLENSTFRQFVVSATMLVFKQIFSNLYMLRVKRVNKIVAAPEDGLFVANAKLPPTGFGSDHPEFKRAQAIVQNDFENLPIFFVSGICYVGAGGSPTKLLVAFAVFRWLHVIAYINAKQPYRAIFYLGGLVCNVILISKAFLACVTYH